MNTNDESKLIEKYGITCLTKTIYQYQGYSYDKLDDALKYAAIDRGRNKAAATETTSSSIK